MMKSVLLAHSHPLILTGTGTFRINPSWQIAGEFTGYLIINAFTDENGDSEMYSGGAHWTPRASKRFSPYAQLLIGGRRITHEIDDMQKRKELMDAWDDGSGTLPIRSAATGP